MLGYCSTNPIVGTEFPGKRVGLLLPQTRALCDCFPRDMVLHLVISHPRISCMKVEFQVLVPVYGHKLMQILIDLNALYTYLPIASCMGKSPSEITHH